MSLTLKRRVTVLVVILLGSLFFLNLSEASAFDRTESPTYYGDPPPELLNFQPNLTNLPTTATARQKFGIAAHPWWLDMFLDQFIAYYKDLKITTVRLRVVGKVPELGLPKAQRKNGSTAAHSSRKLYWGGQSQDAQVYLRSNLGEGSQIHGPAIIEQEDTTTLILAGWQGRIDATGNLIIEAAP